jgi:hypothetical protein
MVMLCSAGLRGCRTFCPAMSRAELLGITDGSFPDLRARKTTL